MSDLEKQVHQIFVEAEVVLRSQTVFDGTEVDYFEDDAAEVSLFPALVALNEIARSELKNSGAKDFASLDLPPLLACTDIYQLNTAINQYPEDFPILIELLEVTNSEDFQWNPLQIEPILNLDEQSESIVPLVFRGSTYGKEEEILNWAKEGIDNPFADLDPELVTESSPEDQDLDTLKMSWLTYPSDRHKDSAGIIWELYLLNEKIEIEGSDETVHFHAIYKSLSQPHLFKVILLRTGLPSEYSAVDDQNELTRVSSYGEQICSVTSDRICTEIIWLRR